MTKELLFISLVKCFVSITPTRLKYRVARFFYNYDSKNIEGVDIAVRYLAIPGLHLLVNTKDYIGWNIFFRGFYENETNEILKSYVKYGDVVIEAGANNGSETILLGHLVGDEGKVYAFEPVSRVNRYLKANVALNSFDKRIIVEELALGETESALELFLPRSSDSNQGTSSRYKFSSSVERIAVEQITLDVWVVKHEIKKVSFIKIDIQGAELDMLNGSKKTIAEFRPYIYLEADEIQTSNADSSLNRLFDFFCQNQYIIYHITERTKVQLSKDKLLCGNWLAVPNKM